MVSQRSLNELALFAGAGGGILGGHLLGWRTVCAVEWEPYAACVLAARQNDGVLPPFPIWDDVQTFDGRPWRGIVDVISGGFPCQDISAAGKGAGIDGERSGMWREMARIIHEVRPRFVFVENSPMLTSRGLGVVLGDLASMGFDAKWGVLGAADVGAPHQRDRIWIKARQRNILPHTKHDGAGRWEQQPQGAEKTNGSLANPSELLCDGGDDNTRVSVERKQISEFRDGSRKENVSDPNGFSDAMRGDSQNYAETVVGWEFESRGSVSDSGARCQESAGESSDVANSMRYGLQRVGEDGGLKGSLGLRSGEGGDQEQGLHMANTQDEGNVRGDGQLGVVEEKHHHRGSQTNGGGEWWQVEPNLGRVADGVAARVDRLKSIGNGQVPEVARRAWEAL
jgi:DNA (cytosine-5)-methyltransferase 1